MQVDVISVVVVIVSLYALSQFIKWQVSTRVAGTDFSVYEKEIARLEKEIEDQRHYHEDRIREVEAVYEKRIEMLESQIRFFIYELAEYRGQMGVETKEAPKHNEDVLLVCGNEVRFCATDRRALRRAGVSFFTVQKATKKDVSSELQRARQDRKPYTMVHIAAHSDGTVIMLESGPTEVEWWASILDGVDILFLSACRSHEFADKLTGLVDCIITVRTDVEDTQAEEFGFLFWRAVKEGRKPQVAFELAREQLPALADSVGVRVTS